MVRLLLRAMLLTGDHRAIKMEQRQLGFGDVFLQTFIQAG